MTGKVPKSVGAILAAVAMLALTAAAASAETIYNKIPSPLPGNVASQAFEATSTSEFGGEVEFAGVARKNPAVSVIMSSWACENLKGGTECHTNAGATFAWPITLNIYEVGPGRAPGALLATTTSTFNIPYRPSANNKKCTPNGEGVVGFGKECFHGKAFKITFPAAAVTLPPRVILSIAYNTTDYGYAPTHEADVGEDSLNVGYYEPGEPVAPVGSTPFPNDGYLNSSWSGAYCNGAEGTGTFRLDSGCYGGYQPAFAVKASK
jgi:hypothetical protein